MNNMRFDKWIKISFLNLLIVSFIGVILRYKIAFSLPFVEQKYLLHAHSHFAFTGWLSQLLMTLIVKYIFIQNKNIRLQKYRLLLGANLLSAYGMLLSFPFQGYGEVSIFFSTLSIFISYAFALYVWRDLNALPKISISHNWFKAALLFNAVSSLGAFALAFMMINKIAHATWFLAAEYFFLHFQYNGWFFFACMGLLQQWFTEKNIVLSANTAKAIFWLFCAAVVPAYFLSALWLPIPFWLYILVVAASIAQCGGLILLIKHIKNKQEIIIAIINRPVKWLWLLSLLALAVKLLLQLGSVIPSLSQVTFGFRPIVIGYLHLVLLGMLTIFLLGYYTQTIRVHYTKWFYTGLFVFGAGILINEVLLMLQGVNAMMYSSVPFINEMLLVTAIIMFSGLVLINRGMWKSQIILP